MLFHTFDNGDKMPLFGLGTWKSAPGDVYKAVKEAIRVGYRHIDCAYIYGNEKEVGQAIAESIKEGVVASRQELFVVSKLWSDSLHKDDVLPALKNTLSDLQLDYVDLYMIHWPVAFKKGVAFPSKAEDMISLNDQPLIETWKALEEAVESGLIKHLGMSNFSVKKTQLLLDQGKIKPEVSQTERHPYLQQTAIMDFCKANSILVTGYSPLGSLDRPAGLKGENEPVLLEDPIILEVAKSRNLTPAQVLIKWQLQTGGSAVAKSVRKERLVENLEAVEKADLTADDLAKLATLDRHLRLLDGSFFFLGPYTKENIFDE